MTQMHATPGSRQAPCTSERASCVWRFVWPLWPVLREGLLTIAFAFGANQAARNGSFLGMSALIACTGYQARRMWLTEPYLRSGRDENESNRSHHSPWPEDHSNRR